MCCFPCFNAVLIKYLGAVPCQFFIFNAAPICLWILAQDSRHEPTNFCLFFSGPSRCGRSCVGVLNQNFHKWVCLFCRCVHEARNHVVTAIEGAMIDKARQSTTFCCECEEWIVVRHGFFMFKNTDVIYNVLEMVKLPCYVNRFFNCYHDHDA